LASLVVQTSFIGDVVLTTPLIAELGKRGPVDVVTGRGGAALLANNPAIRRTIVYEKSGSDGGIAGFVRARRRIRSDDSNAHYDGYDAAYLAQGSVRSALLAIAAGSKERIGFGRSAGRALYTRRVLFREDRHHAERLWSLSMSDCADPPIAEQIRPRLYPGRAEEHLVDAFLADSRIDMTAPFIVLAPGAAWGTKKWPFYPELAAKFADSHSIIVIGGSEDQAIADSIIGGCPSGRAASATGRLTMLASAEMIRRAQAIVCNDSSPQHLASAVGTPTLSIFGPTVTDFGYGPLAPGSTAVGHDQLRCRPCHHHGPVKCPLGHWRCMRELSSSEIAETLTEILSTLSIS
jgi:lipopolysaccharide heptosyltransferase II